MEDLKKIRAEFHAVVQERDTYKHAFETTAADRDRIAAELATLRTQNITMSASHDRVHARRPTSAD